MCLLGPPADGAGLVESQGLIKEAVEIWPNLSYFLGTSCVGGAQKSQKTVVEIVPMAANSFILPRHPAEWRGGRAARGRSLRSCQWRLFYQDLLLSVENEEKPEGSDRSCVNVDCSTWTSCRVSSLFYLGSLLSGEDAYMPEASQGGRVNCDRCVACGEDEKEPEADHRGQVNVDCSTWTSC